MSIRKKLFTIIKTGVEPLKLGIEAYAANIPEVEEIAKRRAEICKGCELYEDEPIDFLQVRDDRIPELSKKMCGDCGCALPTLLRQNAKICSRWGENKKPEH